MTITYIENLSPREGLKLHESFSRFAQGRSLCVLTEGSSAKIGMLGETHKNMEELVRRLNDQMTGTAVGDFTGFAGKRVLSCHFVNSAYEHLRTVTNTLTIPGYMVKVSGRNEYWMKAVTNWFEARNRERVQDNQQSEQIRIQQTGDPGVCHIHFPDLETLKEFEFRLGRHEFDTQARALLHKDAGVALEGR